MEFDEFFDCINGKNALDASGAAEIIGKGLTDIGVVFDNGDIIFHKLYRVY